MRCGVAVSLMGQTGQSEAIHSPEAWAKTVLSRMMLATSLIDVVCTVAISCWLRILAANIEAARQWGITDFAKVFSPGALTK